MVQRKNNYANVYATKAGFLQNDLLRSAKLGPWQKEKQQLKMGVLFLFSVFCVVFPLCSFFYWTNRGVLLAELIWVRLTPTACFSCKFDDKFGDGSLLSI